MHIKTQLGNIFFLSSSQLLALNLRNLWESLVTAEEPAGYSYYLNVSD